MRNEYDFAEGRPNPYTNPCPCNCGKANGLQLDHEAECKAAYLPKHKHSNPNIMMTSGEGWDWLKEQLDKTRKTINRLEIALRDHTVGRRNAANDLRETEDILYAIDSSLININSMPDTPELDEHMASLDAEREWSFSVDGDVWQVWRKRLNGTMRFIAQGNDYPNT